MSQNGIPATPTAPNAIDGLPEPIAPGDQHEGRLRSEHERAVRVRGDGEQDRCSPQAATAATAPRSSARSSSTNDEQREEQEEAVHPRVDTVEEKDPAPRDESRRDQRRSSVGEPPAEQRDERQARDRERGRDEPQAAEAEAEMRDGVGEEEMERGAAAFPRHVVDDAREAVAPDEERERLVLVRRPRHQLVHEERRGRERDARRPRARTRAQRPTPAPRAISGRGRGCFGVLCHRRSGRIFAGRLAA